MTVDQLIEEYKETSRAWNEAQEASDPEACDRCWDEMVRVRAALRAHGEEGTRELLALLESDEPRIRLSAAVDALELSPEDGLRVLRELRAGPLSEISFNAKMILWRWDRGDWP